MPCFLIFIIKITFFNVNVSSQMALTAVVWAVKFCIRKNLLTLSSYPGLVHIQVKSFIISKDCYFCLLLSCFVWNKAFQSNLAHNMTWINDTFKMRIVANFKYDMDVLQGSFRLCNWLSLRSLVSWINHLLPACWSTFWKSNSKQQLGCRFDIMDYESYFFVFWHMQLYMSWYIRSFFGFTFLNIL